MGIRCRETTNLEDNAYNRRILKKRLEQLQAEITLGTFEYEKYFPKSKRVEEFKEKEVSESLYKPKFLFLKSLLNCGLKQKQVEWRDFISTKGFNCNQKLFDSCFW